VEPLAKLMEPGTGPISIDYHRLSIAAALLEDGVSEKRVGDGKDKALLLFVHRDQ
jgi:hypothetical protein